MLKKVDRISLINKLNRFSAGYTYIDNLESLAQSVSEILDELASDREKLTGLRPNWAPPTKEANAKRYVELYRQLLENLGGEASTAD